MAYPEYHTWRARDGLMLSARIYSGDPARAPVLCLPGLTRNGRDFADLAAVIAPGRRVICPDMRGRGRSAWASDPATYTPLHYLADVEALLADLAIARFVAIGTSLGGLLTMLLAGANPARLTGAVLNDIGPEIAPGGLARIRGYVGTPAHFADWSAAGAALAAAQGDIYPDYAAADWERLARRIMRAADSGAIVFDYDPAIAIPLATDEGASPAPDLWPLFDALAAVPLTVVRGGTSDILTETTTARMQARHPALDLITIPGVGHAPTLDEPAARAAIARLLDRVP